MKQLEFSNTETIYSPVRTASLILEVLALVWAFFMLE